MAQKRVSISEEEWEIAKTASKKNPVCQTPTAWIRYIIRKNGSEAQTIGEANC